MKNHKVCAPTYALVVSLLVVADLGACGSSGSSPDGGGSGGGRSGASVEDAGGSSSSSSSGATTGSSSSGASGSSSSSGSSGSSASSGGGTTPGNSSGSSSGSALDGGQSGRDASSPPTGNDGGPSEGGGSLPGGALAFAADRIVVTGLRGVTTPAAQSTIQLHNAGQAALEVTNLSFSGASAALFRVSTALPATIQPGSDLVVTVAMTTAGATLPALPPGPAPYDAGSNLLTATLTATFGAGTAQTNVYGLLLVPNPSSPNNFEPTLGQILTTLGYRLNVGQAQNDWNPNTSMMATTLPGVEANTDEVAAPLFVKAAATGPVTMQLVARFSPAGVLPYGYYPSGSPTTRTTVGTMSMVADAQTSDKARMVFPPLAAGSATTFEPGSVPFGVWIFSDQKTEMFNEGGNPANGDYDFSQDALNTPANVHRVKTYPLRDATGAAIAHEYLVAVEEASNGDYQDYVFVLGNVSVAP